MKKTKSTYDRVMADPKRKARFEAKYQRFSLSEILLSLMESEHVSVRALAKKSDISAALIQSIRSGKQTNITMKKFLGLAASLGATIRIEKGDQTYPLQV